MDDCTNPYVPGIYFPEDMEAGTYWLTAIADNSAGHTEVKIEIIVTNGGGDNGQTTRKFNGIMWPLDKNYNYTITSVCGYRTDPVTGKTGTGHKGIDIARDQKIGEPIMAAADGIAYTYSQGVDTHTGYGNYIIIDHENGFYTLYGHMSAFADGTSVIGGTKRVSQGEVIGFMGSTGKSTGPHLHFEIRYCKNGGNNISSFFSISNWSNGTWEVVDPYPGEVQSYRLGLSKN